MRTRSASPTLDMSERMTLSPSFNPSRTSMVVTDARPSFTWARTASEPLLVILYRKTAAFRRLCIGRPTTRTLSSFSTSRVATTSRACPAPRPARNPGGKGASRVMVTVRVPSEEDGLRLVTWPFRPFTKPLRVSIGSVLIGAHLRSQECWQSHFGHQVLGTFRAAECSQAAHLGQHRASLYRVEPNGRIVDAWFIRRCVSAEGAGDAATDTLSDSPRNSFGNTTSDAAVESAWQDGLLIDVKLQVGVAGRAPVGSQGSTTFHRDSALAPEVFEDSRHLARFCLVVGGFDGQPAGKLIHAGLLIVPNLIAQNVAGEIVMPYLDSPEPRDPSTEVFLHSACGWGRARRAQQ